MANQNWHEYAYPLQQITVQLQGTKHSQPENIIDLLEHVLKRLRAGDMAGEMHDDDFGYRFVVAPQSTAPSFFGDSSNSQN